MNTGSIKISGRRDTWWSRGDKSSARPARGGQPGAALAPLLGREHAQLARLLQLPPSQHLQLQQQALHSTFGGAGRVVPAHLLEGAADGGGSGRRVGNGLMA